MPCHPLRLAITVRAYPPRHPDSEKTVPQVEFLGLSVPDDQLKWDNESGHYHYGPIDWDEFYNVLKGNGPCNTERLAARNKAWDDGAWVRDGLMAHAAKKRAAKLAAE